jgi:2-C-methyl-D-erythritol 4-phosphate cytidylyltransferase
MAVVGAIVVAAGASSRMGGVDKVFAALLSRPLLAHSVGLLAAHPLVDEVVLVVADAQVDRARLLVREEDWAKVISVCPGGVRRQDSVARGLEALSPCRWVVVHDGARPCLEADMVSRGLEAAGETGAAVAAIPMTDTVKVVDETGLVEETPPRDRLWVVQTPQVFRYDLLVDAHRRVREDMTDDASMVERLGNRVRVFRGSSSNLKVTTRGDLVLAEAVLRARCSQEA